MNQEKIGNFIRELRNEMKMTQQELAEKIGVTDRAISKWENGRGSPDISLLIPLSKELGITVLELLNGEKVNDENNAIVDLIKENNKKTKIWKFLFLGIINIILIIMILISIFCYIIPKKYENSSTQGVTTAISSSMEPTIKSGNTIIYNKVDINKVKKNDIIVYYFTDNDENILSNIKIIHRVIEVIKDKNNNISLITRGDNNKENDKIYVTEKNFLGVYNHKISNINNLQISTTAFIFLIIGILNIIYLDILQLKKSLSNK